ncbi:hypothetical protein SDC49_09305 [Lactobacillus sp. R2/2]|nr:hypothetical protein [Lactobacillus sp. R2/2]
MSIGPLSEWVTATAEIVKMIKVYSIVQHIIEILNNDNIPHAKKKGMLNNCCNISTKRVSSLKAGYLFKSKEQLIIMKK